MSILKAACIGIAGTFLALQFQNTRKEYGDLSGDCGQHFPFSRNEPESVGDPGNFGIGW